MLKRLIQGLLLGLLAVHINAYALGLGEIQLDSALNQPLSAEIELLSTTPEDADSIAVSLASYETFSKVGIDRPSVLALLRFNVAAKGDGYVINIDSHDPIREPFLDFILEVTWSSGRVLREYTLLLDPPVLKRAQPTQIKAPAAQPKEIVEAQRVAAPVQQRPAAKASKLAGSFTPTDEGGISYGPVRNGETLWGIAREMRQDSSVTTQQMLMALLAENPGAFIAGDINRLKRGSILRLNNPDIVGSISRQQAAADVAQRTQPSAMPRAADVDERSISADSAEAQRPSLKLVTPDYKTLSEKMGATVAEGGDNEALRQELILALEISEAQRRENEALKERMSDLQKQLDSLKRLITLKDSDLAQMQQQLVEPGDVVEADIQEVAETAEAPSLVIPELPEAEDTIADALKQEEAVVAEAPAVTEPQPVPQPQVVPAPVAKPAAKSDFFSTILSDPMFMATGGGALALILLLVLLMIKRRGNRFHESILTGDASSMGATATGGPDTSFLSDLAISGLAGGSMESDEGEVDPITEADVYMAYGRFQQAESLLKDALESDPERLELKSKLLEVFYTAKDKEQFDAIIAESSEQLQADDESWKKLLVMGHELSPENPLFAEAPEVEEAEDEALDLSAAEGEDTIFDDVLDIGIDLDELTAEMESSPEGELDIDLGLDFSDLDDDIFSTSAESSDESSEPSSDEVESFDLSDLDLDIEPEAEAEAEAEAEESSAEAAADEGGIDFDIDNLGLDELSAEEDEQGAEIEAETAESTESDDGAALDFSLEDLDNLDISETEDLSAELDDALASIDDDLNDIGELSDLSADDNEPEVSADETTTPESDVLADLDFDLESAVDESPDESKEDSATPALDDMADLDFESIASDSSEESSEETPAADANDLGDFDFDFESIGSDSSADSSDESTATDEFDISDDFELELEGLGEVPQETSGSDDLGDLSDLDTVDESSLDDGGIDALDIDDSELDSTEGDMDTKIDLAKAYIEMGDADGARNMLSEVITQGDDEQKQQAQDLLDSI